LQAQDAGCQEVDADPGAERVEPARLENRRAEEDRREDGQQVTVGGGRVIAAQAATVMTAPMPDSSPAKTNEPKRIRSTRTPDSRLTSRLGIRHTRVITRPENNSQFCYIHDPDHTMIELVFHARRPYPPVERQPQNTGISQAEFGNKTGAANSADVARAVLDNTALAEGR
jgi:hypothetical protein